MRSMLAIVAILVSLCLGGQASCAETFPYVAYVGEQPAAIHAGPGKAHYATDQLSPGMKVEVFREVTGWLAIKPPAGSFSWVPARDVELTDTPDIAQVLGDDVVAWIGTRVEKNSDHVWQIRLQQGDQVQVLGVKRRPGEAGKDAETWYRIAPPEGEYRWIAASAITREPARLVVDEAEVEAIEEANDIEPIPAELAATEPTPASDGTASVLVGKMREKIGAVAAAVANLHSDEPIGSGVEKAQFVQRIKRNEPRVAANPGASNPPAASTSPFKVVDGSAAPTPAARDTAPRVASLDKSLPRDPKELLSSSTKFEDRLTEIELQLSLMAAKDPSEWQLDTLQAQAEQLVFSGQTTLERGRARLTLDKIAQFKALADRRTQSPSTPRTNSIEQVQEAALPPATAAPAAADTNITPASGATPSAEGLIIPEGVSYDGVGWLKPVYSAKRIVPPYALVDIDGKVLQYVTPTPGLNLNRYVKKPVGVFGQKSHLAEFKAGHVTASKIVDLTRYQQ